MLGPESSSYLFIDVEEFVTSYFGKHLPKTRCFHDITHTHSVANTSKAMAVFYGIPLSDAEALSFASWFHDIGYCHVSIGHEEVGIAILKTFLSGYHLSSRFTNRIEQLIMATEVKHQPKNLLEKIIRDADLRHIGSTDYPSWSERLRKEIMLCDHDVFTDVEWNEINIKFFKEHQFYTTYANEHWENQKQLNLQRLIGTLS